MVMEMFAQNMGVKVIRVNAEDLFLGKLKGEADPEAKRKIIGNTFIEVFDEEASKLKDVPFLAQGTIYPDRKSTRLNSSHVRISYAVFCLKKKKKKKKK